MTRSKKTSKKATKQIPKKKELTRLGAALRSLGGLGGSLAGGFAGNSNLGRTMGTDLGAAVSRWLGAGDYQVARNSLLSAGSGSIPMMHKTGQTVTVRHREFIGDVVSPAVVSAYATVMVLPLNPGLTQTFPWLAAIAQQFQEYTIKGMIFHYVPTSGESVASASTALGSVMIATNYRATAPAFASKIQLLNEFFSCDAKPSQTFVHPIECDPKENPYNVQYVRSGDVPSGEDQKTYDLGVTTVAVQGYPSASITLGEIWATYEIELKKPISVGFQQSDAAIAHMIGSNTLTAAAPLGLARSFTTDTFNSPTGSGCSSTSATLTLPPGNPGRYLVIIGLTGAITAGSLTQAGGTNATLVDMNCGPTQSNTVLGMTFSAATISGGGPTTVEVWDIVNPALSTVFTFALAGGAGTIDSCDVFVYQVSTATL